MIQYDYTFHEKIEVLDEVRKFLEICDKKLQDNSQSINENVDWEDKEKPSVITDLVQHNLADCLTTVKKLDDKLEELDRKPSNNFILEKGNILLEATQNLADIDGRYPGYFKNFEISSKWFLTTDMKVMNKVVEDILVSTKPSRNKSIPKSLKPHV